MTKYQIFSKLFSQNINAAFSRVKVTTVPVSYDRKLDKIVDHGGVFGTLLTGLSITFDLFRCMTFSLQNWNDIFPKQIN